MVDKTGSAYFYPPPPPTHAHQVPLMVRQLIGSITVPGTVRVFLIFQFIPHTVEDRVLSFSPVVGIGTPRPLTSVPHPRLVPGGEAHSLPGGKRGWRAPIPAKGHTLWYWYWYICILCLWSIRYLPCTM
jgi:hypothetical protein